MEGRIIITFIIILNITACGILEKKTKPPYDVNSPNTLIAWCPSDSCPNSRFYLNTAYFTNDYLMYLDDMLLVYHGSFCTILDSRTVENYTWTDGYLNQTILSNPVDVWLVECDNRFRRISNGDIEYHEASNKTEGWVFPNAMMSVEEYDRRNQTP